MPPVCPFCAVFVAGLLFAFSRLHCLCCWQQRVRGGDHPPLIFFTPPAGWKRGNLKFVPGEAQAPGGYSRMVHTALIGGATNPEQMQNKHKSRSAIILYTAVLRLLGFSLWPFPFDHFTTWHRPTCFSNPVLAIISTNGTARKVVLAYSGGLDTSVILKWLAGQGFEVIW